MTAGRDAPRRPIDDPVVLARVAAIFRASAAEKLSRSATPPALKREAGDPLPLHGVPGHLEETDTATGREQ